MRGIVIALLVFCNLLSVAQNQPQNTIGFKAYKSSIKIDSEQKLLEIKKEIPSISLDIKYATKANFSGIAVYPKAKAFARKPVVEALKKVQAELQGKGLGLKIFDAYRPYSVTVKFWDITPKNLQEFVSNPQKGSRHNRGCAIDLTLINVLNGEELNMPTPYDSFTKEAYADAENVSSQQKENRDELIDIMQRNGFKVLKNEWWHFDFIGWENYPLMDINFRKL
jgi:D-alanyl-D-alanine dipeptidase